MKICGSCDTNIVFHRKSWPFFDEKGKRICELCEIEEMITDLEKQTGLDREVFMSEKLKKFINS